MSLDYYLFCKDKYELIRINLDEIIEQYELILDITTAEELEYEDYEIFKPKYNKIFFIREREKINKLINECNKKIQELCQHNFIDDLIDITPDKSKYIRYCSFCELTK